jgi:uncharacterized protein
MAFRPLPRTAAWHHYGARLGFEVAYFEPYPGGHRVWGCTAAVEAGATWVVEYKISVDDRWGTRRAEVMGRSAEGTRSTVLEGDGSGGWRVDGVLAPDLAGCLDVDLESSAVTNMLPVHRLNLSLGRSRSAPAAYVRAADLRVERLDQTYRRAPDLGDRQQYEYAAPAFGFTACLSYDETGLVLDYPGIAHRVGL